MINLSENEILIIKKTKILIIYKTKREFYFFLEIYYFFLLTISLLFKTAILNLLEFGQNNKELYHLFFNFKCYLYFSFDLKKKNFGTKSQKNLLLVDFRYLSFFYNFFIHPNFKKKFF